MSGDEDILMSFFIILINGRRIYRYREQFMYDDT